MRPAPDMPAATPFQALPPRRSNGEVGWQARERMRYNAMHRSIANKFVGQPQRAADAREAELPASPVAESQRALMTAVRVGEAT